MKQTSDHLNLAHSPENSPKPTAKGLLNSTLGAL